MSKCDVREETHVSSWICSIIVQVSQSALILWFELLRFRFATFRHTLSVVILWISWYGTVVQDELLVSTVKMLLLAVIFACALY